MRDPKANLVATSVMTACLGSMAFADTLLVPSETYPTIQSAIDAANDGDEIVVAPGTYHEIINFLGKAITLRSSDGADVTIIDGTGLNDSVVKCASGERPTTILQGFTITGGTGTPFLTVTRGGGMYISQSSPTLVDCHFLMNSAYIGGGLSILNGSPAISDCLFVENTAEEGAGLDSEDGSPIVVGCVFDRNTADFGGGGALTLRGQPTITGCSFTKNNARSRGGGLYNVDSKGTVSSSVFDDNTCSRGDGGGICNLRGKPEVRDCTLSGNEAWSSGGGIYNLDATVSVVHCGLVSNTAYFGGGMQNQRSDVTADRCTFQSNRAEVGGGITNFSYGNVSVTDCLLRNNSAEVYGGGVANLGCVVSIVHCTFRNNSAPDGAALSFNNTLQGGSPTSMTMSNSILWDDGDEIWNNDGSTVLISYSNVRGGFAGLGNIDVFPGYATYPLLPNSPMINAGDPAFVAAGATDIEGNPRVLGCRTDMGAHESLIQQAFGDFDGSRRIDLRDFAAFQNCMGTVASQSAWSDVCVCSFDSNDDELVDIQDYAEFGAHLGEGRRPPPKIDRFLPLPGEWVVGEGGLWEVEIGFTEPVLVPPDAIQVWTTRGTRVTGFTTSLDESSNLLTVRFAAPIVNGRVTVVVDFNITGLTGTELDGEIADPDEATLPSGDGFPGGQGVLHINVLQGDANRDGGVDSSDQALIEGLLGLCNGDPAFDPSADLNSDGCINEKDAMITSAAMGAYLVPKDGTAPMIQELEIEFSALDDEFWILIRFTEQIDLDTFQLRGVFLVDENGSVLTPSWRSVSGFTNAATYYFFYPLDECAEYLINVSNAFEDFSGESLVPGWPRPCP